MKYYICCDWSAVRKLVYYVATSIDGYIADTDGKSDVFPVNPETLTDLFLRYPETCPDHIRNALGVVGPPRRFDTVIMGYKTYKPALDAGLSSPYPQLRQIVVTHRELPEHPSLEAWSGDLGERVAALKELPGKDIWLCGGGQLASQLVTQIDELQIKVNPVSLGSGTPLFGGFERRPWILQSCHDIPGGVGLLTFSSAG